MDFLLGVVKKCFFACLVFLHYTDADRYSVDLALKLHYSKLPPTGLMFVNKMILLLCSNTNLFFSHQIDGKFDVNDVGERSMT